MTAGERAAGLWIKKRLDVYMKTFQARGYSFERAFDASWRRCQREAGFTRVEIARANLDARDFDKKRRRRS